MTLTIDAEAPTATDVRSLLEAHLAFARATSPADHVHALDPEDLSSSGVSMFVAREFGEVLGVGALRRLDSGRVEIKSMHTAAAERGRGVGRAMLMHLIATARTGGFSWIGLETGTMDEFAPARRLYESAGFAVCEPFGHHTSNAFSTCMSLDLEPTAR